jgi:hypothetical protein
VLAVTGPPFTATTCAWCGSPFTPEECENQLESDKERAVQPNKGLFAKLSDEQETTFHPEITTKAREQRRNSVIAYSSCIPPARPAPSSETKLCSANN